MAGMTLPDAPWRDRAGMATLLDALDAAGGQTRFVGGAVRDTLAGRPVSDVDLATRLMPQAVVERIREAGLKVVPTGLAHGTVTVVLPDGAAVEVTTLRRDVSTDGRRATVAFSDDWREDAARRDFTINALYADPASGAIHDYFGGEDDLARGLVRFIGDARQRIAEDHLRILRFFRFHARYGGGAPDELAYDACAERANDLMALSRERIADEMLKLLASDDPAPAIGLMLDRAILKPVLPEIDAAGLTRLRRLIGAEKAAGIAGDRLRRLIALMPVDGAVADGIAARLRLSNARRKRITAALGDVGDAARPRVLAFAVGTETAVDRLLLAGEAESARGIMSWTPPALPVSGETMLGHGLRGVEIAQALKVIRERWSAEDFPGGDRIDAIVAEAVDQASRDRQ